MYGFLQKSCKLKFEELSRFVEIGKLLRSSVHAQTLKHAVAIIHSMSLNQMIRPLLLPSNLALASQASAVNFAANIRAAKFISPIGSICMNNEQY